MTGLSIEEKLFNVNITKSYVDEDIVDIIKELLEEQPVFITNELPSSTGKKITINFDKEDIFSAIQKVIAPFNYRFWAEPDYKVYLYEANTTPISTDSIAIGDVHEVTDINETVNFYNRVTIQGKDSTISSTENDVDAQDEYGIIDYFAILPSLQTTADTSETATNMLSNNKDPTKKYNLTIKPIYYTKAGYRLEIEYPIQT